MAKIIYGPLVELASGNLSDVVFSKNRSGAYVRNKVTPRNPKTKYQTYVRARFGSVSSQWKAITQSERQAWIDKAATYLVAPKQSGFSKKTTITGKALFQEINTNRLNQSLAITKTPPTETAINNEEAENLTIATSTFKATLNFRNNPSAASYLVIFATNELSQGISFYEGLYKQVAVVKLNTSSMEVNLTTNWVARFGRTAKVGANIGILIKNLSAEGWPGTQYKLKAIVIS